MYNVKNKAIIKKIAWKSFLVNRTRNIVAIIAIALTALMFTSVFTIGGSLVDTIQESNMRTIGTSTHAGYKYLTEEMFQQVKNDSKVSDIGKRVIIGSLENEAFSKLHTEISYEDETYIETSFIEPSIGTIPSDTNEVLVSSDILDALGLPQEIGQKICLGFTANGTSYSDTFLVSGIYEQDRALSVAEVITTYDYAVSVAGIWSGDDVSDYLQAMSEDSSYIAGSVHATFNFPTSIDIRGQMDELNVRMGFDMTKVKDGINWAYQTSEIDPATILLLVILILIIVGSGYLIVYNVFLISVSSDIKFYGLLKTIGTTGKQLKKIVRMQALLLYVIGLPLGLLLGYITGIWLMPVILGMTSVEHVVRSMNPWIFIIAAVFTFITVMVSTNKPAKLVAKISPIESMKQTSIDKKLKKNKRTRKVTAFTMAMANVGRSKVKTTLVLTSLLLSALTFNVTYTYVNGFDMDSYLSNFLVSDFLISDSSILNVMSGEHVLDGVDQEFLRQLEQEDSVDDIGKVYVSNWVHLLNDQAKERVEQAVAINYEEDPMDIEMDMQFLEENKIKSYVYGVSENLMEKIVTESNDIAATKYLTEEQMEKFKTGNYVLTTGYYGVAFPEDTYYQVGEMVMIDFGNGTTKEYEVLSAGTLPYALDKGYSTKVDVSFILPESEYCSQLPDATPLKATICSNNIEETTKFLDNYIATSDLDYKSKATYEEEFEAMKNTFMITGFVLSAILGLIGIVNFMNLMITSVSARKLELAMLQSLGLGGRQLKKMLIYESIFYSISILLFITTIGAGITYFIVEKMNATIIDTSYQFEIVPVIIIAVVLGSISAIMPLVIYRQFKKLSIVERLREIG